ncbi:MAG: cysteine--tRNA ligase [Chloroflexi bacterium]|nr:MAG: cysteine--tRNA ligase [Chloroflexota bacterium]
MYRPTRMLALYDTLRRRRVPFRPRGRTVTLYVCGVTPYDTTHLGHARTFLVFDVLIRHLEAGGLRVKYAQNVTDIDESILQRAADRGRDWRELGRDEERKFLQDMRALSWRRPDVMPHATREIDAMRALAERLERRGHAYRIPDGGLYYEVTTFPRYGRLSRFSPSKMRRVLAQQDDTRLDDSRKRSPLDFALWRRVADGPTWPSEYGPGRPGWHLECSAMSLRHLDQPLDVHGGGDDLIFPHHESEIAQSEGATGRPFARYWVHVAAMKLGGEKMSKSKGNMVFVRDALTRVSADGLRLYLLSKHYRKPFEHDEEEMRRWGAFAVQLREMALPRATAQLPREVKAALDDDLDTPRVLRLLRGYVRARDAESATVVARYLGLRLR